MSAIIEIKNALFRRIGATNNINNTNSAINVSKHIFPQRISQLEIKGQQKWAVVGSHKTELLEILCGKHVADPGTGRKYPQLTARNKWPQSAITFLNFGRDNGGLPKMHLSARYEFFKEDLDQTVYKFVTKHIVNASESDVIAEKSRHDRVMKVLETFQLSELKDNWLMGLSNGQLRRARFAKSLIHEHDILVVDDPFLGLDPKAKAMISGILSRLSGIDLIIGLRVQDTVPDWISHVALVDSNGLIKAGRMSEVQPELAKLKAQEKHSVSDAEVSKIVETLCDHVLEPQKPHITFNGVNVAYKGKSIISNLHWNVLTGDKVQIKGENGSGKTTVLSLITADHPQSWNSKIAILGNPRIVGKSNYHSLNAQIGMTSPELHAIFPGNLTVEQCLKTSFKMPSSFVVPKQLGDSQLRKVAFALEKFGLFPKKDCAFSDLSISDQKVVLFLRAILKSPEILILDEAFSCMIPDKIELCKKIVAQWPNTVLSIAHVKHELPRCDKVLEL